MLVQSCFGMTSTRADDTELFIYDFNKAGDFRPKVLLIFDNSGSMADTMEQIKEAYNPATVYPALSNDPDKSNTKQYIYFSTDGSIPAINSNKRFSDKLNLVPPPRDLFASIGYFQSQVWTYEVTNGSPPGERRGAGIQLVVIRKTTSTWSIASRMSPQITLRTHTQAPGVLAPVSGQ